MAKGYQDKDLYPLYLKWNKICFEDCLPKTIIVSRSLKMERKAGVCYFYFYPDGIVQPFEICLSDKYISKYPDDTDCVLLHEMIHMKLGNIQHNTDFVNEMNRLNFKYKLNIKLKGQLI